MASPDGPAPADRAGAGPAELAGVAMALALLITSQIALTHSGSLLTRPFWLDEIFTHTMVADPSVGHALAALAAGAEKNPPGLLLLLRSYTWLTGTSEASLRLFTLLSVLAALVGLHACLRRSFALPAAALAVLATWSHPLLLNQAFNARFYGPWLAAITWYVYLMVRLRRPGPSWGIKVALAGCAVLVCTLHYFGVISLALATAGELLARRRHPPCIPPFSRGGANTEIPPLPREEANENIRPSPSRGANNDVSPSEPEESALVLPSLKGESILVAPSLKGKTSLVPLSERGGLQRGWTRLWPALAGPLALLACVPMLLSQRGAAAEASWMEPLDWHWALALLRGLVERSALGWFVLAALLSYLTGRPSRPARPLNPVAGLAALLAMPAVVLAISWAGLPAYEARYSFPTLAGLAVVAAWLATRCSPVWAVVLAGWLILSGAWAVQHQAQSWEAWSRSMQRLITTLEPTAPLPVLFESPAQLYVVDRYAPADLAARCRLLDFEESDSIGNTPPNRLFMRDLGRIYARYYTRPSLVPWAEARRYQEFILVSTRFGPRGAPTVEESFYPGFHVELLGPQAYDWHVYELTATHPRMARGTGSRAKVSQRGPVSPHRPPLGILGPASTPVHPF